MKTKGTMPSLNNMEQSQFFTEPDMETPETEVQVDGNSSDSNWGGRFVGHLPSCLCKATIIAGALATGPITATVAVTGVTAHTIYGICSTSNPQPKEEKQLEVV